MRGARVATGVSDHYGHAVLVTVRTAVDRRAATALASLMSGLGLMDDLRPAYRHRGLSMRPSPLLTR